MSKENRNNLENGIHSVLEDLQANKPNSISIDDFSAYLQKNLNYLSDQINSFKEIEDIRLQSYEKEIKKLQQKLIDFENKNDQMEKTLIDQNIQINTDALTKIANRNFYNISIQKAYSRWQSYGENIVLAIADIDHFKKINDRYGHHIGDKILIKIASILQESIRSTDLLTRYGGEEFVIILEGIAIDKVQQKLDQLRLNIENFNFLYQGKRVPLTISFGATNICQGDSIESLFIRTDAALYQAKKNGRNRVVVLTES